MPQQFLDRDHLRTFFQEVRGEGMAQAVTAGLDASRLGLALHLFLHPFGGQRTMWALLIPEDDIVRHHCGAEGQTGAERRERVG